MKKYKLQNLFKGLVLSIGLICLFQINGCDSTDPQVEDKDELTVNLKSGELYQYAAAVSGDEEGISIEQQAQNYERSEVVRNEETNYISVYYYRSKADFTGKDAVKLKTTYYDGDNVIETEVLTINFIIRQ